jgi:ADP-ribose pyrophosphatase YjhB (NUDIX family)
MQPRFNEALWATLSAGQTSMLSVIAEHLDPGERIALIEDVPEIDQAPRSVVRQWQLPGGWVQLPGELPRQEAGQSAAELAARRAAEEIAQAMRPGPGRQGSDVHVQPGDTDQGERLR